MSLSPGQKILKTFREFQSLNRFIVIDEGDGISLASSHTIIEIDAHPGIDIGSLATILEMPRTSVATIISSLVKKRWVSVVRSKTDQRRRSLKITKRGAAFLKESDRLADDHLAWVLSPLRLEERDLLADLFGRLADGMGAPVCRPRDHEHPVRCQLRRATRALRLIHFDFMSAGLGSPDWQLLSRVAEKNGFQSISQLAAELYLQLSSATTICARLKQKGYLGSITNSEDRRASTLFLTAEGKNFLQSVEEKMADRIDRGLEGIPRESLQNQIEVFKRVVVDRARHTT